MEPVARWDELARRVGDLPVSVWADRCRELTGEARLEYVRARCRWRVDEFARIVMRPALERVGVVSEPNEVDDFVFRLPPHRVGARPTTTQRLLMTGRGIGKTTRLKFRALHGLAYRSTRVGVAIAASDGEAISWVRSVRAWLEEPPPILAALFPELRFSANEHHLTMSTRFGPSHLLARSFAGALRGLNVNGMRPDAIYLDDIEGEDKSVSLAARNKNQVKLCSKVLPLAPIEGGAEVWWVQTPVDQDAVAVRAWRGAEGLQGWTARRLPVVRVWPQGEKATQLWEANKAIYHDKDTHGEDKAARAAAARAHFLAHRETMEAGCEVLDPERLPIDAAYRKRWDVGETAWATEFAIQPRAPGLGVFEPDRWPRFARAGDFVRRAGVEHSIRDMELAAHYDPSDGGDDGALVIVGKHRGRWYLLGWQVWQTARLSVQIAGLPRALKPWVVLGLAELQWEPTTGSASVVKRQIEDALAEAGISIAVVDKPSKEKKEARIVATLEPKGAAGWLVLPDDLPSTLEAQIQGFDPAQRDNRDDFLDAYQRAVERLEDHTGPSYDDLAEVDW